MTRNVRVNISLTLDGHYNGAGGPGDPAAVLAELKSAATGDILINTAPSVAKPLLAADLVDELYLIVTPVITGAGDRLFEDGLPATNWTLKHHTVGESGEMSLIYARNR